MVDEQHRFGVSQRGKLSHKESGMPMPHFLSMTATPIPRTLALTIYADLDLSVISEMPLGRVPIDTKIVPPKDRNLAYEFIRQKLNQGEQAFVICPRIEPAEPSSEGFMQAEMKSVKEELEKNMKGLLF